MTSKHPHVNLAEEATDTTPETEEPKTLQLCLSCQQPWPKDKNFPGFFGLFPDDELTAADDIDEFATQVRRLADCSRVLYHAVFCCWYYEKDAYSGLTYETVVALSMLGEFLAEEIERRSDLLADAGELWEKKVQANKKVS
jgi:hypothetical protein